MAKTKNIYKRYQEQQANKAIKTDGTESATTMLPPQAKGEKRKYTRHISLIPKENKTKVVTVLLTERDYTDLVHMAEEVEQTTISKFIRQAINDRISHLKGK